MSTLVQDLDQSRSGTPWWAIVADLPDNRAAGWDQSAEEGPDEGPPYERQNLAYDQYRDNPATGPYRLPGWVPKGAEGQVLNGLGQTSCQEGCHRPRGTGMGLIPFVPFLGGLGQAATEGVFWKQPWFWFLTGGVAFIGYLALRSPGGRRLSRANRRRFA